MASLLTTARIWMENTGGKYGWQVQVASTDGKSIDHGKNMDGKYRWQVWMASLLITARIWMESAGGKYGWQVY